MANTSDVNVLQIEIKVATNGYIFARLRPQNLKITNTKQH